MLIICAARDCDNVLVGRQTKWCQTKCQRREARRAHLQKYFNITLEEYDTILAEQGGGCGICGSPPKPGKSLAVDHDHRTGYIRGLLCFFCNKRVLGARTAEVLVKTAAYVTNPPARRALGRDVVANNRPRSRKKRR